MVKSLIKISDISGHRSHFIVSLWERNLLFLRIDKTRLQTNRNTVSGRLRRQHSAGANGDAMVTAHYRRDIRTQPSQSRSVFELTN